MKPFKDQPIARKALTLGLMPTLGTLFLVSIASITATYVAAARNTTRDLEAQASIVADSVSAALAFNDTLAATDTLRSLQTRQNIDAACIYDARGALFASFAQPTHFCDATLADESQVKGQQIHASRSVSAGGRPLGTVVITGNLSLLYEWTRIQGSVILGSLIGGTLIALFLTQVLQRVISRPVLELAAAADRVSSNRDYSLRAVKTTDDEVGDLVQSFNGMLDEIQRQNDALTVEIAERKRAEYLKDQFLAAVSHELRTPLNAILGWLQVLRTTDGGKDRLERALESMERNARSQTRVIEDLLDVSRMATGKLQVKMEVVDLCVVLTAAVDVARPTAAAKSVRLDLDVPPTPCLASADGDRLQQVAWNLLSNAIKFTPAGGSVGVTLSAVGQDYVIAVRDTGIGISDEFLPFVFDRFRQADGSMTRQHGGLGLGLAIVKEVTELHHGSVTAASHGVGRGSTFTVRLPQLMSAADRVGAPVAFDRSPRVAERSCIGIRVLAVDDDPDGLDVVKAVLTAAGADVQTASSGREAISAWIRNPGDVLLCDLAMPEMDGFEVLSRLRALDATSGRATAAVALTAYTSNEYREQCLLAGFHAQVGKPYDAHELTNAIVAALGHVRRRPGLAAEPGPRLVKGEAS